MPAIKELISTVIPMMPGKMNWTKFTPEPRLPIILPKPLPKTKRKRRGRKMAPTRRTLSCQKRSMSRYQMV